MAVAVRIGVTGPRGRLGSELVRRGCIPLKCDVTDPAWITAVLEYARPDVVIHCAAITEVDECERRPLLATEVNAIGTWNLARAFNGPIVYLSTDYVFDGQDGPYSEGDRPNPLSVYGWSKLGGEVVIRARGNPRDLIVRTTILFDRWSENFVTRVAYQLLAGKTFSLPADLYGSPTYVPHLAAGILSAIKKGTNGIVNLTGWRVVSRYELGQWVAGALELDRERIARGEASGVAGRPLRAGLTTSRARSLGLPVGDPIEGIKEVAAYVKSIIA